jgi:hypothetical protein
MMTKLVMKTAPAPDSQKTIERSHFEKRLLFFGSWVSSNEFDSAAVAITESRFKIEKIDCPRELKTASWEK